MTEKHIPYGRQLITDEDIAAVSEVLKSDFLTQGPTIPQFEAAFAKYIGADYAVAVANGTAALHLSYLAMDIGPGDTIITSPNTFSASANAALYAGAEVIFADIDPETWLLDLNHVESNFKKGKQIKCITPVDFAGLPVQLDDFKALAEQYGSLILEDACHAPGGTYQAKNGIRNCGDGQDSDLAIFSFHPVKHIAAGEGGMITTNDQKLYKKLCHLRTHGITKDNDFVSDLDGPWAYDMVSLGYNYRLTDIQSALGLSQLRRAEKGLERRRQLARKYIEQLSDLPINFQRIPEGREHAYHLFVIQTEERSALYDFLQKQKIHPQVHYIPVHLLKFYQQFGWKKGDFPNAESYYDKCLSLPMYPSLEDSEQDFVIQQIHNFYSQ